MWLLGLLTDTEIYAAGLAADLQEPVEGHVEELEAGDAQEESQVASRLADHGDCVVHVVLRHRLDPVVELYVLKLMPTCTTACLVFFFLNPEHLILPFGVLIESVKECGK